MIINRITNRDQLGRLGIVAVGFGFLLTLGFCQSGLAHPFHTSTAEVEYNAETGRFEVALRVLTADLEVAISRQRKSAEQREAGHLNRASTTEFDKLLGEYLEANFYVLAIDSSTPDFDPADPAQREKILKTGLRMIGKELDRSWTWVYFELDAPRQRVGLSLINRVLLDVNEGQINTCQFKGVGRAFRTDAAQPSMRIPNDYAAP